MATHSRILAWRIPWIEEPGGLPSTGLKRWTRLSTFIAAADAATGSQPSHQERLTQAGEI